MKRSLLWLVLVAWLPGYVHPEGPLATFVSSTECPDEIRDFHFVTPGAICEQVNWKLQLFGREGEGGTYLLSSEWLYYPDNRTDEVLGRNEGRTGTWRMTTGLAGYSRAEVLVLTSSDEPTRSVSLLKINDNLLQIVSKNGTMSIGGGGFSNTLSRTDPVDDSTIDFTWAGGPTVFEADRLAGRIVLVGRTPSQDIAREAGISLAQNPWPKIKWKLTLSVDPATGAPAGFEGRRVLEAAVPVKGTWSIRRGWGSNPEAVVYQLNGETSRPYSLYLLKGSEDVYFFLSSEGPLLVGNQQFAYTLNRKMD